MTDTPKTLREMPRDEAIKIFEHWLDTGEVELFNGETWSTWTHDSLNGRTDFRLPVTYPTVDWSHVADWVKHIAFDSNGKAFGFQVKPRVGKKVWRGPERFATVTTLASLTRGTCDWKDSLISRPAGDKE